jgi:hypothetical protein
LGNREAIKNTRKHLKERKANWLYAAARQMANAVKEDWQAWKKARVS